MNTIAKKPASTDEASRPWWRYPIVWMVIGGPFAVVVAGITTAVIAYHNVDPVLSTENSRSEALTPAIQGRNMAAENAARKNSSQAADGP